MSKKTIRISGAENYGHRRLWGDATDWSCPESTYKDALREVEDWVCNEGEPIVLGVTGVDDMVMAWRHRDSDWCGDATAAVILGRGQPLPRITQDNWEDDFDDRWELSAQYGYTEIDEEQLNKGAGIYELRVFCGEGVLRGKVFIEEKDRWRLYYRDHVKEEDVYFWTMKGRWFKTEDAFGKKLPEEETIVEALQSVGRRLFLNCQFPNDNEKDAVKHVKTLLAKREADRGSYYPVENVAPGVQTITIPKEEKK